MSSVGLLRQASQSLLHTDRQQEVCAPLHSQVTAATSALGTQNSDPAEKQLSTLPPQPGQLLSGWHPPGIAEESRVSRHVQAATRPLAGSHTCSGRTQHTQALVATGHHQHGHRFHKPCPAPHRPGASVVGEWALAPSEGPEPRTLHVQTQLAMKEECPTSAKILSKHRRGPPRLLPVTAGLGQEGQRSHG